MLKRIIKTVSVSVTIVCLVVCLVPVQAFAVDPVSYTALAGALDAYGMAYGIGTVVDVANSSGVDASFSGLWDEFSQYQSNNGSNYDYSQFVSDFNENPSIDAFTHSSGKFAAWHIDSESAEIFDQFWNWLLTGPAEMTRVDNEYFQFDSSATGNNAVPIVVYGYGDFSGQPIYYSSSALSNTVSDFLLANPAYKNGSYIRSYYATPLNDHNSAVYMFFVPSGNYGSVYLVSTSSMYVTKMSRNVNNNSVSSNTAIALNNTDSTTGLRYRADGVSGNPVDEVYIPSYTTESAGFLAIASWIQSPVYSRSVGVKSIEEDGISYLPNPYGIDYVPVPLDLVTTVPWDENYPDSEDDNGVPIPYPPSSVPNVVDDIIGAMVDDTYELVEEDEEPLPPPQEVLLPFIPVNIPSFNFNISGHFSNIHRRRRN